MENFDLDDLPLYFAVIWSKLDELERKVDGKGVYLASLSTHLRELEREVEKARRQMR